MLGTLVADNRDEIMRRYRSKLALRPVPTPAPAEVTSVVPCFLDQLVHVLRPQVRAPGGNLGLSAARHGYEMQLQGCTVSQVVHDYGDIGKAVTDLALDRGAPISVKEFRILIGCLEDAVATAVTEYERHAPPEMMAAPWPDQQQAFFTHEVRNLVGTASIAFEVLKTGNVGVGGSTGAVLQRSLAGLRDLIDRSVENVRLAHGMPARSRFDLDPFLAELVPAAVLEAATRGLTFQMAAGAADARVDADRSILAAVITNLVQNAFKFTRPGTCVTLRSRATAERVEIAVEDACGGLPDGSIDDLFRPFVQRSADRTGLGLGLAMCRWGVEVNGGAISARSLPGHGCVFTVELPRVSGAGPP